MKRINNTSGGRPIKTDDLQYTDAYSRLIAKIVTGMRSYAAEEDTVIIEGCEITTNTDGSYNIAEGHIANSLYEGIIYVPAQSSVSLPWRYTTSQVTSSSQTFYNGAVQPTLVELTAIGSSLSTTASYISTATYRVSEASLTSTGEAAYRRHVTPNYLVSDSIAWGQDATEIIGSINTLIPDMPDDYDGFVDFVLRISSVDGITQQNERQVIRFRLNRQNNGSSMGEGCNLGNNNSFGITLYTASSTTSVIIGYYHGDEEEVSATRTLYIEEIYY